MIVLDSSAAVDYLVGLGDGEWVEEHLDAAREAHSPHLIDIEVVAALRRRVHRRELPRRLAREALEDLRQMRVIRYPHVPLLPRMWELRENVTAADAAFVALAEALDFPLVTTDRRLGGAPGLRITVLSP